MLADGLQMQTQHAIGKYCHSLPVQMQRALCKDDHELDVVESPS